MIGPFRLRHLFSLGVLAAGASVAQTVEAPVRPDIPRAPHVTPADLTVMTYNVKGLPWPIASGRPAALAQIGGRLARMRAEGRQPRVVVLQEAFTPEAKAIGDLAGYAYQVQGPYLRAVPGEAADEGGRWYRGETGPSALDSGLVILSDFPIERVERAAFPTGACAGYDCLAAKGIVMARLSVPGKGAVTVAATHLNSRAASWAPYARTHAAYRRQVDFLARFLADHRPAGEPLILAGDFNRGDRPVRIAAMHAAFGPAREGLAEAMADPAACSADARRIRKGGRDMQMLFDGAAARIEATGAEIPFGTEAGGGALSDHLGFTVRYRLVPAT